MYFVTKSVTDMEKQKELVWLIRQHCRIGKRIYPMSSYGLKSVFEKLLGVYISNGDFKEAMILAGFYPCKTKEKNHRYRIVLTDIKDNVKGGEYGRI